MDIHRQAEDSGTPAPEATFTGEVTISGYFRRGAPSRLVGAAVAFAPGARTPWKTTTRGQTLVVTSGTGWAQVEGEAVAEIRVGDLVWCPPGPRHWEGAREDERMTYVAVQEGDVAFGDAVTDAEYSAGRTAP
ncbi:cupin domain-containing protein [Phycicoccus avicenniae]|uniref:cupin domain-containing protein n=1 Tax=Phycicoccus avicenniae TaxID=2828860 RepID=UPI003D2B77D6